MALKETVNIPRDSTLQAILNVQKGILLAQGTLDAVMLSEDGDLIDKYYKQQVASATSVEAVNTLFVEWWHANWGVTVGTDNDARQDLLKRWFGNVLDDERVHGVKFPMFSTSTSAIGELTDDSAGLSCTPSTEATAGQDDFACLPQFWCCEVSMEKNEDGTHTIYAVEFIDDYDTIRSGEHLCEVLQKNTYTKEYYSGSVSATYHNMKMRCHAAAGYTQWPQGEDKNGTVYPYIADPKYYAGLDADGIPTCGTGLAPMNWTSHKAGVTAWRTRGEQYSGASGNLLKWQLAMMWLKYARKGNSGTIEGCSSYNYQYTAAVSESGVKRIILTTAQAANLFVGSSVQIGIKSGTDRNTASNFSVCRNKLITAIDDVTIDGTTYSAVTVDVDEDFDTTADSTYLSTDPYYSGWNDTVLGNDGSRYSYTSGKEPGLIQKTEFMNGSYLIVSDELWQWGTNDDGDYIFDCYTCHDQSKVTTGGTISSDYTKQEDLTLVFAAGTTAGWQYIEDIAIANDKAVLWPKAVSTSAGSGTGAKAGFYVNPATSGVRAAWCVGHLNGGGFAGLPARGSDYGPSSSHWRGSVGVPSGIAG